MFSMCLVFTICRFMWLVKENKKLQRVNYITKVIKRRQLPWTGVYDTEIFINVKVKKSAIVWMCKGSLT